ncbi:hypothetical protein PAHAL_7G167100 [Panicum hallii]|uniref:Xylanase inhibitor C-terminal domain-containing protein n=1 Tax=Panicum hallii TaxID=206008 RepID=A0A2S3I7T4_9POAL|nr:hypothetical protein PAHAL_7G167100 [Panicum hallii]
MSLRRRSSPVLPLLLLLSPPGTLAGGDGHPPSTPIVTHITKDSATLLYTIPVKNGAPLVLDLAGPLVWSVCPPSHARIPCTSSVCAVANRNRPAGCDYAGTGQRLRLHRVPRTTRPAASAAAATSPPRRCPSTPRTAGPRCSRCPSPRTRRAHARRAPPRGRRGRGGPVEGAAVAAVPGRVQAEGRQAKSSRSASPAGARPARPSSAAARSRSWPPRPWSSRRASARTRSRSRSSPTQERRLILPRARVPVPAGALDLDGRRGTGGVTLSTVTPYTALRPDVYRPLHDAFDAATRGIPRAPPVQPFRMCYRASAFGSTRAGPGVASIDLMLHGGRNWTLPGASSLVQVDGQTLCFGFVEMDPAAAAVPGTPAVVVGGFQMQDNLLLFDLEKGTLGISGLLLGMRTHCGNFNFTMGSS